MPWIILQAIAKLMSLNRDFVWSKIANCFRNENNAKSVDRKKLTNIAMIGRMLIFSDGRKFTRYLPVR